MVESVIGERTVDVEALGLHCFDRGPDGPDLFVAKQPVFPGVRIQGRDSDPRHASVRQGPHRPVGQPDFRGDGVAGDEREDLPQSDVQGDVDDSSPGREWPFSCLSVRVGSAAR